MREIDLSRLFKLLLSHIIPIILTGVIFAGVAFGYCRYLAKPVYQANVSVLVNNGGLSDFYQDSTTISTGTLSASLYLVPTCVDVMQSDNIYKELAKTLGDKYSYTTLRSIFSVTDRHDDSLFIDVAVSGYSPEEIKYIANTFLDILPGYMKNTMTAADIKIMSTADKVHKISPQTSLVTLLAFASGVLLCFLAFLIIDLLKNTVESEADIKEKYDVPILGSVPFFENKANSGGKKNGSK